LINLLRSPLHCHSSTSNAVMGCTKSGSTRRNTQHRIRPDAVVPNAIGFPDDRPSRSHAERLVNTRAAAWGRSIGTKNVSG
jgi:hypothetical protein